MTIVPHFAPAVLAVQTTSLQQVATRLADSFATAAFRNRNVVANNIPGDLYTVADEQVIASVLGSMLAAVIHHSRESFITLSARTSGNMIVILLDDYNGLKGYNLDKDLQEIQPLAGKIGGLLHVAGRGRYITSIRFSFPDPSLR